MQKVNQQQTKTSRQDQNQGELGSMHETRKDMTATTKSNKRDEFKQQDQGELKN